jgi:prepilin-type N-terminal cleavage/methylation domain-containing protein
MCIGDNRARRGAGRAVGRRAVCMPPARVSPQSRRGFTLLELLLASFLGAIVLTVVATTIDLHFRLYDSSRGNVEEAQLARVLLGRIGEDLRGAIQYDPIQVNKLMSGASSQSSGDSTSGTATDSADSTDSSSATDDAEQAEQSSTISTTDLSTSSVPATVPGLYGNQYQLQVDVSRLPRIDQLQAMLQQTSDSSAADRPSDVKTVTYYVNALNGPAAMLDTPSNPNSGTGLIRRELDRAVACFLAQQGGTSALDTTTQPLAPEVNTIEFRYFDGSTWLQEWDTSAQGKLPTAIEVAIVITPVLRNNAKELASSMPSGSLFADPNQQHVYRLLVRLPSAQPLRTYSGGSGSSSGSSGGSKDQSSQ